MTKTCIGVISDTHGLLRPQAIEALKGSDLILHAGDIGKPEVLEALTEIAPVTAIRGNVDQGTWANSIPAQQVVQLNDVSIYLIHDVKTLQFDAKAAGFQVVISGHSHKPTIEDRQGVLFLNPGSAGPRRFKLPIAIAQLNLEEAQVNAKIVELMV